MRFRVSCHTVRFGVTSWLVACGTSSTPPANPHLGQPQAAGAAMAAPEAPGKPHGRSTLSDDPSTDRGPAGPDDSSRASRGPTPSDDEWRTAAGRPKPVDGDEPSGFDLVALPVPGFLDAVVALPRSAARKPLAVATHGAGGGPEWPCHAWGKRLAGQRVVLCPRGKAISARENYGFYYPDHHALGAEVSAAIAACRAAMSSRLKDAPILYTGYSQGASMGSLALAEYGAQYPYLVLTEGGFKEWSARNARRFAESGGKRVLFVCGGRGCRDQALKSARLLESAGVAARVEHVPHGGHTDDGAVGARLDATFRWVLEEPEQASH